MYEASRLRGIVHGEVLYVPSGLSCGMYIIYVMLGEGVVNGAGIAR